MMKKFAFVTALVVSQLSFSRASSASAGCGTQVPTEGSVTMTDVNATGWHQSREYFLSLPPSYDADTPAPLVLHFHGWGGSGGWEYSNSGLRSLQDDQDAPFIAVFPSGLGQVEGDVGWGSWNGFGSTAVVSTEDLICNPNNAQNPNYCYPDCPCSENAAISGCWWTSCNNDVAFVGALLDKLENELCIDRSRVYATGESNGGMFCFEVREPFLLLL